MYISICCWSSISRSVSVLNLFKSQTSPGTKLPHTIHAEMGCPVKTHEESGAQLVNGILLQENYQSGIYTKK